MTPAMRVVEEVADELGVPAREILGRSRIARTVTARREAMRRLYIDKRMNTPAIAQVFGVRHTSVRHHLRTVGIVGCRSKQAAADTEQRGSE